MFETTGTIDEAMLKEIQKYTMRPRQKVLLTVFTLAGGFCTVVGALADNLFLLLLGVFDMLVFITEGIWLRRRIIKNMLARTMETVGQPYMVYESSFSKEGVQIHNHSNNAQIVLKYDIFCKIAQTSHVYLLFTKTWQFVPVFKEGLAPGAEQELVAFLQSQPTKIKWKKRRKTAGHIKVGFGSNKRK